MGTEVRQRSPRGGDSQTSETETQANPKAESSNHMEGSCGKASEDSTGVAPNTDSQGNLDGEMPVSLREPEEEKLTVGEARTLQVFREKRSIAEATRVLGVRYDTVKNSLRNIRTKLNKQTNADLFPEGVEYVVRGQGVSTTTVTPAALLELVEAQEYRCAMSGVELTPETAVVDHIVPRKHGGNHVMGNLQWLHKDVNRAKGTLNQEEFIALCRRVVQWAS